MSTSSLLPITPEYSNKVQENYNKISERLNELAQIVNTPYLTHCEFRYNPGNPHSEVNIDKAKSEDLIHVWSFIKQKSEQYHEAADDLNRSTYPVFKWCSYMPESWKHDIELRFKILDASNELNKLRSFKEKLEEFIPADKKVKDLLQEIEEELPF